MPLKRPTFVAGVRARGYERRRGRLVLLASPTADDPYAVDRRAWTILEACDGTRDVDGITEVARRAGVATKPGEVAAFLEELHAAGIVAEAGAPRPPEASPPEAPLDDDVTSPDARVETMPFDLSCDGSGTCCRLYFSVTFSPAEAARARAFVPGVLDAGGDERRAFYPDQGLDRSGLSVCLEGGACAYLGKDRRCRIHGAGGETAKPAGCRLYPDLFVDDGEHVRASPTLECACVFLSATRPATPLPERRRRDLDGHAVVERVPPVIALSPMNVRPRAEVVAALDAIASRLHDALDVPRALLAMSLACTSGRLPSEASVSDLANDEARELASALLAREVLAFRTRVAIAERQGAFRDDDDLVKVALGALGAVGELVDADPLDTPVIDRASEIFFLRTSLWGRHFLRPGDGPLDARLARAAAHLIFARGLGFVAERTGLKDPAFATPLALVEAMGRTYVA